jgi:hypothetical protein
MAVAMRMGGGVVRVRARSVSMGSPAAVITRPRAEAGRAARARTTQLRKRDRDLLCDLGRVIRFTHIPRIHAT